MINWLFFAALLTLFSDVFPRSHINEDKRKTEGQKQIFDVVYEVDGCPVSLTFVFAVVSFSNLTHILFTVENETQ